MGIASCHIQIHPRCSSILLRGWFLCNVLFWRNSSLVDGIFEVFPIRLMEVEEQGKSLMRVIFLDQNNRWPEDSQCDSDYARQYLSLSILQNYDSMHNQKPIQKALEFSFPLLRCFLNQVS